MSSSASVKITARPICILKQPLTISNQAQIVAHTFSRCLPGSGFIHFASLFIHESMDRAGATTINHDDLVVFLTALDHIIDGRSALLQFLDAGSVILNILTLLNITLMTTNSIVVVVLNQSITEHVAMLQNVDLNGIAGSLLGNELGKRGGHVSFADVISIGQIRAVPGLRVTVLQLAHHCPIRARTGLDHNYQVDPGCNDQAKLLP